MQSNLQGIKHNLELIKKTANSGASSAVNWIKNKNELLFGMKLKVANAGRNPLEIHMTIYRDGRVECYIY